MNIILRYLWCMIMLCSLHFSYAQGTSEAVQDKIKRFEAETVDSLKFRIASEIHDATISSDVALSTKYVQQMMAIAQRMGSAKRLALAYAAQSRLSVQVRDYPTALGIDTVALRWARQSADSATIYYTWMGYGANLVDGERWESVVPELEALKRWLAPKGRQPWLARFHYTYGAFLSLRYQFESAESHLRKSAEIYSALNDAKRKNKSNLYLGKSLAMRGRYAEALAVFDGLSQYYKEVDPLGSGAIEYYRILYQVYHERGNEKAADDAMKQLMAVMKARNLSTDAVIAELEYGLVKVERGEWKEVNKMLGEVRKTATSSGNESAILLVKVVEAAVLSASGKEAEALAKFESIGRTITKETPADNRFKYYQTYFQHFVRHNQVSRADSLLLVYGAAVSETMDKPTLRATVQNWTSNYKGWSPSAKALFEEIFTPGGAARVRAKLKGSSLAQLFPNEVMYQTINGTAVWMPSDSLSKDQFASEMLSIEKKYQAEATAAKLKVAEQEKYIEQQRAQRNLLLLVGVALLALFIAFIATTQWRNRRRADEAAELAKLNERRALADKERIQELEDELKHNVRNNFGLIERAIQRMKTNGEIDADVLQARVGSVKELHEIQYGKMYSETVGMATFCRNICLKVMGILGVTEEVELKVDGGFDLDQKRAGLIGRIIGELCTNSCKYAFEGRTGNAISIYLRESENDYELSFSDNGIGVTDMAVDSFGQKFIRSTVRSSLSGTYERGNDNGFYLNIKFPKAHEETEDIDR